MTGNVVKFYPKNSAECPDAVLEQAVGEFSDVIVVGWDKEGELDVRANTRLTHKDCLWLIEMFKTKLVLGDYGEPG